MAPVLLDIQLDVARRLARHVFARRGNHTEAHLKEIELAAIIALGIDMATAEPAPAEKERT